MWKYRGQQRPEFAVEPGPGQESVWDYPRPPALVPASAHVEIRAGNTAIAESDNVIRVLETASPPTWYVPPADVQWQRLVPAAGRTWCEWKGEASYWALAEFPDVAIGWTYPEPLPAFASIRGYLSAYPGRIECYVDGERVRAQAGAFYGGWVTDEIVGPFKGDQGTGGW
jgi:uncharacterized protein (DUF427 family)